MNKAQKFLIGILAVLVVAAVGFYIYDVIVNGTDFTQQLPKIAILAASLCYTIFRILKGSNRRKPLSFYEKNYSQQLDGVYSRDAKSRKKLLRAIRLFNEGNYKKAISMLDDLKADRPSKKDIAAVCLFSAVSYERWGIIDKAIEEYKFLLANDPSNSTALSNLGTLYEDNGEYANAEEYYVKAIEVNPDNHFAYNNLSQLYYKSGEIEGALVYAHKTLELSNNFRPAATLLAIIYRAIDENDKASLYRHIAVTNGADGSRIDELAHELRVSLQAEKESQEQNEE